MLILIPLIKSNRDLILKALDTFQFASITAVLCVESSFNIPIMHDFGYPHRNLSSGTRGDCRVPNNLRYPTQP